MVSFTIHVNSWKSITVMVWGALSEEGLEAANKHIRQYLELFFRKTCPISQLTDVMNRLLEHSNPIVLHQKEFILQKKRKDIVCLECGSLRHTT